MKEYVWNFPSTISVTDKVINPSEIGMRVQEDNKEVNDSSKEKNQPS